MSAVVMAVWLAGTPDAGRTEPRPILRPEDPARTGAADLGVPLPPRARCLARTCNLKNEVAAMCTAFGTAHRRLTAGASWAETTEPIATAGDTLCCEDLLNGLRAIEDIPVVEDKRQIWCFVATGGQPPCAPVECPALTQFWKAYLEKSWETSAPRPVSKPKK